MAGAPDRPDRVTVDVDGAAVVISTASRDRLLLRLKYAGRGNAVIDAFTAAGASRPVVLTADQKSVMRDEIAKWAEQVTNMGLPPGIDDLLHALDGA